MTESDNRRECPDWLRKFAEYDYNHLPEEKPVEHCLDCGGPIYEGDTVFIYNDRDYYCEECIEKGRTIMKRLERVKK